MSIEFSSGAVRRTHRRRSAARRLSAFGLLAFTLTAACEKDRNFLEAAPAADGVPVLHLTIWPRTPSVAKGQPLPFAVQVRTASGDTVPAMVEWSASAGATINKSGVFRAEAPGDYTVAVRLLSNDQSADSVRVVVTDPDNPIVGVEIDSTRLSIPVGTSRSFTAVPRHRDGSPAFVAVHWRATHGVIDLAGLYTAPAEPAEAMVIATAGMVTDTAYVSVFAPATIDSLRLEPREDSVEVGGRRQFRAVGLMSDGDLSNPQVDFSVDGGGEISVDGLFIAGDTPGGYLVTARERTRGVVATGRVWVRPEPVVRVVVSPADIQMIPGASHVFVAAGATASGAARTLPITWSATGGTITSSGRYTAGNEAGKYHVVARSSLGLVDSSEVTIVVPVARVTSLRINPSSVTLAGGEERQFVPLATWSDGSGAVPNVEWSATGGTITPSGLYTAGTTVGSHRVIAKLVGGALADTSEVTIAAAQLTRLVLSPKTATVTRGSQYPFSVTAQWSDGGTSVPSLLWSASGGTITQSGVFTAGSSSGTYRVIVRDPTRPVADTGFVTIASAAPVLQAVRITPKTVSINPWGRQTFQVSGVWTEGGSGAPQVTWSATGGLINGSGRYYARSTPGVYRVIARQVGGTLADTAEVTVGSPSAAPELTGIDVSPSGASVTAGATRQYSVTGAWSDGSTNSPSVAWTTNGGTISSSGLFTAGENPGGFRVVAITADGALADTVPVTVTAAAPTATLTSLTISPKTTTVQPGAQQQFAASARWSNGGTSLPTVSWTATGGSVNASGRYTAPTSPGTYRVAVSGQGRADTAVVTVPAPAPAPTAVQFTLSPASAVVTAGGTVQFQTSTVWSDGTSRPVTVTYSATGGTISVNGTYVAGQALAAFAVIASCSCGLADTSTVVVNGPTPVPTLASLTVSPSNTTVLTGSSQQFSVSGRMSDGSTVSPSVTWSAAGGTVSSSGLFTASASTGTGRVIARSGSIADTAQVTVVAAQTPPPTGSPTPNRPSNYTRTLSDYGFSDAVPTSQDGQLGSSGWLASWNSYGLTRRGTDASAPMSASSVLESRYAQGHTSGGGVGNVGRSLPGVNQIYIAFWLKFDSNFEFHPISNKMLYLEPGNVILEARHFETDLPVIPAQSADLSPNLVPGFRMPLGRWMRIEYLVDAVANRMQLWVDGTKITDRNFSFGGNFRELKLDTTWGGSGGTKSRDSYRWIDHIVVATP